MNTEIIVAIIGLLGVIISVFATARTTQNKINIENQVQGHKIDQLSIDIQTVKAELTAKMESDKELEETKINHINESLETLKVDVKEHNHYAKLFSETVPVIQEQIKVINHRLEDAEHDLKDRLK